MERCCCEEFLWYFFIVFKYDIILSVYVNYNFFIYDGFLLNDGIY